ncbi:hypothetical protein [Streptomyces sparsogenes]|uniref:hypothetical protein n=1 Tax=Streptomyces sparsogenes TaxID=67365 RepID=UPI003F4D4773
MLGYDAAVIREVAGTRPWAVAPAAHGGAAVAAGPGTRTGGNLWQDLPYVTHAPTCAGGVYRPTPGTI